MRREMSSGFILPNNAGARAWPTLYSFYPRWSRRIPEAHTQPFFCLLQPYMSRMRSRYVCFDDARALAGAHSLTAEDKCCSDCTPSRQACLIPSGPNANHEDNVVTSAAEGGCCGEQSCPTPAGLISDNENNVAGATTEGNCSLDCTLECHPARGQVCPVDTGPTEKETEKEDIVALSTVNTRASIQLIVPFRVSH